MSGSGVRQPQLSCRYTVSFDSSAVACFVGWRGWVAHMRRLVGEAHAMVGRGGACHSGGGRGSLRVRYGDQTVVQRLAHLQLGEEVRCPIQTACDGW